MLELIRRIFSNKFFPLCWTLFTVFLLCLPGSLVPGTGLFSIKHLDKIVHVFLFGMNVLLWGWHYTITDRSRKQLATIFLTVTLLTIVLGVIMEYIQLYYIPNRSFDGGDIVADAAGAIIAGIWLIRN